MEQVCVGCLAGRKLTDHEVSAGLALAEALASALFLPSLDQNVGQTTTEVQHACAGAAVTCAVASRDMSKQCDDGGVHRAEYVWRQLEVLKRVNAWSKDNLHDPTLLSVDANMILSILGLEASSMVPASS